MLRPGLKNKFNKNPTEENKTLYKKQRNFCVSLLKKEKRKYYNNLDLDFGRELDFYFLINIRPFQKISF